VLIAIFIIALSGCAPSTPIVVDLPTGPTVPAASNIGEAATIPPATPTEANTPVPTETPFVPKATIKIAVHVPLSGGGARAGTDILHAAELAAQQLAGPLIGLGYQIELIPYDDQSSVEIGVSNAQKITADLEILCGLGHINSNVMIQSSEKYHQGNLAFISPASTSSTVTDRYYPDVNRVIGRDDGQGMAGAQFALSQGYKRVYIIHSDTSASEKSADYFIQEAYRLGISVIGISPTEQKENFDWIIRRILSSNPDMVFFSGRTDQVGPFFREARAAGYTGTFLGTDVVNRSALLELAGPALVEGGGMYYTEVTAPANNFPDAAQFINDYDITYGSFPGEFAAQAYDATGICMKAIEEAVKAKSGEILTRKEVANAIRNLVDYKGITSTYNFDSKGDPALAKYFIFKVVSPDPANWSQNTVVASYYIQPPR
jgi:branched-chain amino acid transport system substrate-binding protein